MSTFTGASGIVFQVYDNPFARGGEGSIHNIQGDPLIVAKIYRDEKRTTELERKLQVMVNHKPGSLDQYAWPLDILYENGRFAGFVMPKVTGKEKLRNIYVYDNRVGKPWTLYVAIAKNLASAVHNIHAIGQVIGDLNPDNILVDPASGLVTLVDMDSYHITDSAQHVYRCGVGVAEFIAPELHGKHFPSAPLPTFSKDTDRFSLAVLIFALLMNGAHPFTCTVISDSSSQFQPIDNMKNGTCPYFADSSRANIDIPRYAPRIESLPDDLQTLFHSVFVKGLHQPSLRPLAEAWYHSLESLENKIKVCQANSQHLYYYNYHECPWCQVKQKMSTISQTAFTGGPRPAPSIPLAAAAPAAAPQPAAVIQPPAPPLYTPTQYAYTQPAPAAPPKKSHSPVKAIAAIVVTIIILLIIKGAIEGSRPQTRTTTTAGVTASTTTRSVNATTSAPGSNATNIKPPPGTNQTTVQTTKKTIASPTPIPMLLVEQPAVVQMNITQSTGESIQLEDAVIIEDTGKVENQGDRTEYTITADYTGRYRVELVDRTADRSLHVKVVDDHDRMIVDTYNEVTVSLDGGKQYRIIVSYYTGPASYRLRIGYQKDTVDITGYTQVDDSLTFSGQQNWYTYTAPLDGIYRFDVINRTADNSVRIHVINDIQVALADSYNDATVSFVAGKTYQIGVIFYSRLLNYTLQIGVPNPVADLSGITIVTDEIRYTNQRNIYTCTPSVSGIYYLEARDRTADNSVRLFVIDDIEVTIAEGYNDVPVRLDAGRTYVMIVNFYNRPCRYTLHLGVPNPVIDISGQTKVADQIRYANQVNYYEFKPATTGAYVFEAQELTGDGSVMIAAIDDNQVVLSDRNYNEMTVNLQAGKTYTIIVSYYKRLTNYQLSISH